MNIIFLDIDGVLNSRLFFEGMKNRTLYNKEDDLDPKAISFLNDLIKDTEAKVVISSSWRGGETIASLQALLQTRGFAGTIIGFTPRFRTNYVLRGNEIHAWICENIEKLGVESYSDFKTYVILDDDSDMLYWQRNNFFLVDGYVGLTPNIVYKATRFLKGKG